MANSFNAVLTNKHFRNLWLGQITSQIALNMLSFILAIRVYQETNSNAAVSLLLLVTAGLPSLIFGVVAGGLVDYYDKRDILFFSNIVRVFLFLAFFFFSSSLAALYVLSIITSIVTQLFIPSEAPSIPVLVKPEHLLSANSLFTVSFYLSTVLGFVIAGPILKMIGSPNVYLVMVALMSIASFFVFRLPKIGKQQKQDGLSFTTIGKTIYEGLQFIRGNKRIEQSILLMTFAQALIMTLSVLTPGFADKVLRIDLADASFVVMGPAVVGLVFGAFLIGGYGKRFLKGTLILFGILSTGLVLFLLSLLTRFHRVQMVLPAKTEVIFAGNLIYAELLLFALGFFNSFITVPANTILQQDSEGQMRGRVYGVLTSLVGGVSALPVIFSGVLADVIGVGKTLTILGSIVCIAGLYHLFQRRKAISELS